MIKRFIENIAIDKLRHLAIGVLYSLLIVIGGVFGVYGAIIGFIIGTILNAYKEIYHDKIQGKGKAELLDFIWNEIPIVITFIAYLM